MNSKDVAIQYIGNGLCTLPAIRSQKRPMCKWTKYQHELPTEAEWEGWKFADALCIVCGKISGNLLMIDFDQQGKALPEFKSRIAPELYSRLVIEQSQSGGFHIIVRSEAPIPGNTVLAKDSDGKVLIETRGEGGIFLCSPTPGYVLTQGDFQNIPVLRAEVIETLLTAAWSLDQTPQQEPTAPPIPDSVPRSPVERRYTDKDFKIKKTIPNYTEVFTQDAIQIKHIWLDGRIVPLTDELALALARARGHGFIPGVREPRFWMMALGIVMILFALGRMAYKYFKSKGDE